MQSAYLSLQLPYVYFGLGDSGNYVQQIYFGVPTNTVSTFWIFTFQVSLKEKNLLFSITEKWQTFPVFPGCFTELANCMFSFPSR